MGTQPKSKMNTIGKENIIISENLPLHSVQRKQTQIHALWAYNSMNLEKNPSLKLYSELPFTVPEIFLDRPQRDKDQEYILECDS